MSELLKINVNEHTERKNGLTYLSWAWAWAEVLKIDPLATWEAAEFNQEGSLLPCMLLPDGSAMVKVAVTIKGHTKTCLLPVMNHKNQAIKGPDAFAINTAIVRCLTKAISMHGLGLYIYAGEDLPEGEEPEQKKCGPVIAGSFRSSATMNADGVSAFDALEPETRDYLRQLAEDLKRLVADNRAADAYAQVTAEQLDDEQSMGLWCILDSKTRAAIKSAKQVKVAA
ncbi:DUF1071 domain-containing protein [Ramlibacter sp. AN1015]|uniref:Sak single strand annealing protein n=1 Tax=Ramlibacter sp. AN1015 TaxID=3133428 RepID=UPI0030BB5982